MEKLALVLLLLFLFSCSDQNSDNSDLFLGEWRGSEINNTGYGGTYTLRSHVTIENQDKDALKVSVRTSNNFNNAITNKVYTIYRKSETTFISPDNENTIAFNKTTGNIEINGIEHKRENAIDN